MGVPDKDGHMTARVVGPGPMSRREKAFWVGTAVLAVVSIAAILMEGC